MANFFCTRPDSKYFNFCMTDMISVTYSSLFTSNPSKLLMVKTILMSKVIQKAHPGLK